MRGPTSKTTFPARPTQRAGAGAGVLSAANALLYSILVLHPPSTWSGRTRTAVGESSTLSVANAHSETSVLCLILDQEEGMKLEF